MGAARFWSQGKRAHKKAPWHNISNNWLCISFCVEVEADSSKILGGWSNKVMTPHKVLPRLYDKNEIRTGELKSCNMLKTRQFWKLFQKFCMNVC